MRSDDVRGVEVEEAGPEVCFEEVVYFGAVVG